VKAAVIDGAAPSQAAIPTEPAPRRERQLWGALLLAALFLRLVALGDRPLHHDESIHAWFSDHFLHTGEYKYDPVYHGPVQYFAVASSFLLLGGSDFTARLPAALGGTALVGLAFLLRRRWGPRAAFAAGALAAFSPNLLYFTRFCREDVWSLLGTAGTLLFFDEWLASRRIRDLVAASLFAVVAFASKENFYVLLALMAPSVAALFWEPGRGLVFWNRIRKLVDFLEENSTAIAGALLLFFVVSELCYTVFLVHPESGNPAFQAISYWWGQHSVERVGGPKTYYLPRLMQYEFALLVPALLFAFGRRRELTGAERFLLTLGVTSVGMYAYLGEKTPWLIVHQLLPFIPLAGAFWAALFARQRPKDGFDPPALAGLAVLAASFATAVTLSYVYPALTPAVQKAESVVYVQTAPELKRLVGEIEAAAAAGAAPAAAVQGESGWPLNWYLRKIQVDWSLPVEGRLPPIVIVDTEKAQEARAILGPGYREEEIPLRAWWVPETSLRPLQPTPRQLLEYLFTRTPWSIVGAQRITVFRRVKVP
jgi:uncharacterized protein (TIGR03663 family)